MNHSMSSGFREFLMVGSLDHLMLSALSVGPRRPFKTYLVARRNSWIIFNKGCNREKKLFCWQQVSNPSKPSDFSEFLFTVFTTSSILRPLLGAFRTIKWSLYPQVCTHCDPILPLGLSWKQICALKLLWPLNTCFSHLSKCLPCSSQGFAPLGRELLYWHK